MEVTSYLPVVLASITFIGKIVYDRIKNNKTSIANLIAVTVAAMSLPDIGICIFLFLRNPIEAVSMPQTLYIFVIGALLMAYVIIKGIVKTFNENDLDSE